MDLILEPYIDDKIENSGHTNDSYSDSIELIIDSNNYANKI